MEKLLNDIQTETYFKTILTRAWNLGGCVTQQCDVGLSISLPATQPWLSVERSYLFFASKQVKNDAGFKRNMHRLRCLSSKARHVDFKEP